MTLPYLPNEREYSISVLRVFLEFGFIPVVTHRGSNYLIREHPEPN